MTTQSYAQGNTLKIPSADVLEEINGVPIVEQGKSILLDYIEYRIFKQNTNFICFATGLPGTGKSVSMVAVCERFAKRVGQPFSIRDNVASGIHDLVKKVAMLEQAFTRGENIRGRPLILDDAGVSMDSRFWHEKAHKMLNDLIEVFRYLGIPLFITVPNQARVDSKLRDLAHAIIKVVKKKEGHYTLCKFYLSEKHWKTGDYIPTLLRAQHQGWTYKIDWVRIRPPSIQLRREYEEWMREFKGNLIQGHYEKLQKKASTPEDARRMMTEKQKWIYLKTKSGLRPAELAQQLGISEASVNTHLRNIRGKGWDDI